MMNKDSPTRIGLKLLVSIAVAELLIMLLFRVTALRSYLPPLLLDLADAVLLAVVASVMVFYWVVNPMKIFEERRKAAVLLQEQKKFAEDLIENTPIAAFVIGPDHKVKLWNRAAEKLSGAPASSMIGTDEQGKPFYGRNQPTLADAVLDGDGSRHREAHSPSPTSGHASDEVNEEGWFQNLNGRDRYLLIDAVPIFDGSGRITAVIETLQDITERKQAEAALAASAAEFRWLSREFHGLLDAIPDSIKVVDSDLKVFWANRTAAESIEAATESLAGRHCYDLWYQRQAPCDPCIGIRCFETGQPCSGTVTRPDGRTWDIRTLPLFDDGGRVRRVVEVQRDITEFRNLQNQYLQAQKMESIGTLAGGIAHDFNNMLSAIFGYSHIALMKMAEDDPQRQNIEAILDAAERASRLTRDLLLFSRKQASERGAADLSDVITGMEKLLRRVIGEEREFRTKMTGSPLPIFADTHQLDQVLMNLAVNARDAMPQGGIFTLETEAFTFTDQLISLYGFGRPGPYAVMTVSDTGVGMDIETLRHIFEPFFTTKEVGKGTGLGLAVVFGIVREHEGFISVYSEPGKGTTFRIYLPILRSPDSKASDTNVDTSISQGTETILVADDDSSVMQMIRIILSEFGYTVIEANDGREAVRIFNDHCDAVHLLLFDLIMPKKNGRDAYEEIRAIKPGVKAIFLSGYSPDIIKDRLPFANDLVLLHKPITPTELLKKVRNVLDG